MYRSILSLSKIVYQMWHYHPFSQRNMTAEKTVGAGVGGDRELGVWGVWIKFEKGVCGEGNIGGAGLHKITGLAPSANYIKRLITKLHPPPPFLASSPISGKNFPSPHYSHFWKISSCPHYEGRRV